MKFNSKNIIPSIVFIAIGVFFLLKNLGYIPEINWSIVWPVIVIFVWLCILFSDNCEFKVCSYEEEEIDDEDEECEKCENSKNLKSKK